MSKKTSDAPAPPSRDSVPPPSGTTSALKKWRLIAILSLAANLFLVGIVVGAMRGPRFFGDKDGRTGARNADVMRPFSAKGAERALGRDVRPLAEEARRAHEDAMFASFEELRSSAQQATAAMQAEPFDADALRDALATVRAANGSFQQNVHAEFVDFVASLTPEQRKELAEASLAVAGKPRRGPPRDRDRGPKGPRGPEPGPGKGPPGKGPGPGPGKGPGAP